MTITIHWWLWLGIALIIAPIIYGVYREHRDWDLMYDVVSTFFLSWCMAVGIVIGYFWTFLFSVKGL